MKNKEQRLTRKPNQINIEERGEGDDKITKITGYGAVFYSEGDESTEYELFDGVKERVNSRAFDRALQEKEDVRGLFNHNPDKLLGRISAGTMKIAKDKKGLRYEIGIDESDPDHQSVLAKIRRGDLTGSSFSFIPEKVEWSDEDGYEIRELLRVRLLDTGPVSFPAYESSTADLRSNDNENVKKELEDYRNRYEGLKKRARAKTIELERDGYTQ